MQVMSPGDDTYCRRRRRGAVGEEVGLCVAPGGNGVGADVGNSVGTEDGADDG